MKRIGFLSYWGFGSGLNYVTLMYAKMLQGEHEVFILKQGTNEISEEFKTVDVNITEYPEYIVDKETFKKWVVDNKLDAVVFNEYKQWTNEPDNLVNEAKELGCKAYGYLVAERFHPDQTKDYDRILVPTVSMERLMRRNKIRHFTYVPYSIDFKEMDECIKLVEDDHKFTFFHPGGHLGVNGRKSTLEIIEAFERMSNVENCKLIITSQKPMSFNRELHPNIEIRDKELSRKELIGTFCECDATVLPSKWETIGISILESLAMGKPVVTTNAPPMNEFIQEGTTGYLCDGDITYYDGINIEVFLPSISSLKNKMEIMSNKTLYSLIKKNTKHIAEEIYDLEKNKKYFLEFLKEDLK